MTRFGGCVSQRDVATVNDAMLHRGLRPRLYREDRGANQLTPVPLAPEHGVGAVAVRAPVCSHSDVEVAPGNRLGLDAVESVAYLSCAFLNAMLEEAPRVRAELTHQLERFIGGGDLETSERGGRGRPSL